jgi:transposase IS66-like protein
LIGEEASERYEYIPASLLVIEDVCLKYACDCTVRTAGKPAQPIEKSTAGASLSAQIEREIKALGQSGLPRADWIAKTLLAAAPQMP